MTVLYSERESEKTKAQFVALTQQTADDRQLIVGSSAPMVVIDVNHQRLHEGVAFFAYNVKPKSAPLGNGQSMNIVLACGPSTSAHLTLAFESAGDGFFEIYENTTSTGGSLFTPVARNRVSANVSNVAMVRDATITTAGTVLWQENLIGGTGKKSAGGAGATLEFYLAPLTNYMIRLTNVDTSDHASFIGLEWYE
jgi:hypothetical protein